MTRVRWTNRSQRDLKAILDFIRVDSPQMANEVGGELLNLETQLSQFPMSGRVVPEYSNSSVRELIHMRYRLIYYVGDGEISILAVLHERQIMPPFPSLNP